MIVFHFERTYTLKNATVHNKFGAIITEFRNSSHFICRRVNNISFAILGDILTYFLIGFHIKHSKASILKLNGIMRAR